MSEYYRYLLVILYDGTNDIRAPREYQNQHVAGVVDCLTEQEARDEKFWWENNPNWKRNNPHTCLIMDWESGLI